MLNVSNAFHFGSSLDLAGRVLQHLRTDQINDQVFKVVQSAYEKALAHDHLVLSHIERQRLPADVLKSVFSDMNRRLSTD